MIKYNSIILLSYKQLFYSVCKSKFNIYSLLSSNHRDIKRETMSDRRNREERHLIDKENARHNAVNPASADTYASPVVITLVMMMSTFMYTYHDEYSWVKPAFFDINVFMILFMYSFSFSTKVKHVPQSKIRYTAILHQTIWWLWITYGTLWNPEDCVSYTLGMIISFTITILSVVTWYSLRESFNTNDSFTGVPNLIFFACIVLSMVPFELGEILDKKQLGARFFFFITNYYLIVYLLVFKKQKIVSYRFLFCAVIPILVTHIYFSPIYMFQTLFYLRKLYRWKQEERERIGDEGSMVASMMSGSANADREVRRPHRYKQKTAIRDCPLNILYPRVAIILP